MINLDLKQKLYLLNKDSDNLIKIEFDRMVGTFYGTGDAFAAMVLAWLTKLKDLKVCFLKNIFYQLFIFMDFFFNLKSACEHTISAMMHILKRTNG